MQNNSFLTKENNPPSDFDYFDYFDYETSNIDEEESINDQNQQLESLTNITTVNDINTRNIIVQNQINENNALQKDHIKKHIIEQNSSKVLKIPSKRKPKRQIKLSNNGEEFQKKTYKLLNGGKHKRARKDLILKYHIIICEKNKDIRPLSRNHCRQINNYFNDFADQQHIILEEIKNSIEEGKINYEKDYNEIHSK